MSETKQFVDRIAVESGQVAIVALDYVDQLAGSRTGVSRAIGLGPDKGSIFSD